MRKDTFETKFTKNSSKGQIVIPSGIRKQLDIANGSLLAVTTQDDMIVLKKVTSKMTLEDMKTLKLVEEA
jgi:AbrB family looped-hinge helix DNA binding protein